MDPEAPRVESPRIHTEFREGPWDGLRLVSDSLSRVQFIRIDTTPRASLLAEEVSGPRQPGVYSYYELVQDAPCGAVYYRYAGQIVLDVGGGDS